MKSLKRKNFSKQTVSSSRRTDMKDDQNGIILETDDFEQDDDNSVNLNSSKVCRKEFLEVRNKMQRARTGNLLKTWYNFIKDEGNSLTVTEVLGYLPYRVNYQTNRDIANSGSDIFNSVYIVKFSYNEDEAIVIMHQLILSKEQLRTMKRIVESKEIHFPNTSELNEARKKLRPVVSSVLDGTGVYVDYYNLVTNTATSLLGISIDINSIIKL